MKNTIFTGMASAIVTPMKSDLSVDYEALGRFIDFQIENGINAIVAVDIQTLITHIIDVN